MAFVQVRRWPPVNCFVLFGRLRGFADLFVSVWFASVVGFVAFCFVIAEIEVYNSFVFACLLVVVVHYIMKCLPKLFVVVIFGLCVCFCFAFVLFCCCSLINILLFVFIMPLTCRTL